MADGGKKRSELCFKNYKESTHRSIRTNIAPISGPTFPTQAILIEPKTSMTGMQLRKNRTTDKPGIIDLPNPRRSSSEVVAEKLKKKETTTAKANKKREQEARVARVEKEIKIAQRETQLLGRGQKGRVKKTFPRETPENDGVEQVSSSRLHLELRS